MDTVPAKLTQQVARLSMSLDRLEQLVDDSTDGDVRRRLLKALLATRTSVDDVVNGFLGDMDELLVSNKACREIADVAILHAQNSARKASLIAKGDGEN
jgi:hypothetical protein